MGGAGALGGETMASHVSRAWPSRRLLTKRWDGGGAGVVAGRAARVASSWRAAARASGSGSRRCWYGENRLTAWA